MVDYEMKQAKKEKLLERADSYKRALRESIVFPKAVVELSEENGIVKTVSVRDADEMTKIEMGKSEHILFDFGTHEVGYVTLHLKSVGSPQDAPAFIKMKFGESAKEMLECSEDYDGWISRSWIQEEFLHIDVLPAQIQLPRRYAFRYMELLVIDTSPKWKLVVEHVECRTVSAVSQEEWETHLENPSSEKSSTDIELQEKLEDLRKIGLRTLKNCMQDVFEDGPKRDRRLWLGDLRLQALADYASFKNFNLVKRCLYLFAGLPRQDGKVSACLFTEPVYQADNVFFFDYSLFFISALKDYYEASKDIDTLRELWPTAARQFEISAMEFQKDGWILRETKYNSFIDWKDGLDKQACSQAVYIYAANDLEKLALILDKQEAAEKIRADIQQKKKAAMEHAWDEESGLFVSGPKRQVSYATQAWMILAGVIEPEQGREVLERLRQCKDAVGMVTPYMNHHYTEALFLCKETDEAIKYMNYYWGGMSAHGADTFWELYNPDNPQESPYGSSIVNSYCHAWSCTPVYLIRKYIWKDL